MELTSFVSSIQRNLTKFPGSVTLNVIFYIRYKGFFFFLSLSSYFNLEMELEENFSKKGVEGEINPVLNLQ